MHVTQIHESQNYLDSFHTLQEAIEYFKGVEHQEVYIRTCGASNAVIHVGNQGYDCVHIATSAQDITALPELQWEEVGVKVSVAYDVTLTVSGTVTSNTAATTITAVKPAKKSKKQATDSAITTSTTTTTTVTTKDIVIIEVYNRSVREAYPKSRVNNPIHFTSNQLNAIRSGMNQVCVVI